MNIKSFITTLLVIISIVFDTLFSVSKYPVLTLLVCGIVIVYIYVSPFIYSSR